MLLWQPSCNRALLLSSVQHNAGWLLHVQSGCSKASLLLFSKCGTTKFISSSAAARDGGRAYVTSALGAFPACWCQQSLSHVEISNILPWAAWANTWAKSWYSSETVATRWGSSAVSQRKWMKGGSLEKKCSRNRQDGRSRLSSTCPALPAEKWKKDFIQTPGKIITWIAIKKKPCQ